MIDTPIYECPQCGQRLRRSAAVTCPCCGFLVTAARIRHNVDLRYWRYRISRSRLDVLLAVLWLAAMVLAAWVVSLNPGLSIFIICFMLAITFTYLRRFLSEHRKRQH